ncbi:MAG: helix-turn-helix transcriptional regulator [Oscillospiraceae bacterium]|nr:helix-turn-helix transcriptional regulator [Oscillospiraceae bacterium]
MILSEKIASLRKKAGWPQEELAVKLGVSRQSVSKWESGSSVPDLDKILRMSELFGVSADYLLKDELEDAVPAFAGEEEYPETRSVSPEEADSFLEMCTRLARRTATAVAVLICSPIALILLAGMAEAGRVQEDLAGGLGTVILLLLAGAAVAVLILDGMKADRYEYLEKEEFTLQYGVKGIAEKRRQEFEKTNRVCTAAGTVICILSVVPLLLAGAFGLGDLACIACTGILLLLVAAGVWLFVWAGTIYGGCQKLLQEGDYTKERKQKKKKRSALVGVYWCVVTAVYLAVSLPSGSWESGWIIWPCAGLLFAALWGVLDALESRKKDRT